MHAGAWSCRISACQHWGVSAGTLIKSPTLAAGSRSRICRPAAGMGGGRCGQFLNLTHWRYCFEASTSHRRDGGIPDRIPRRSHSGPGGQGVQGDRRRRRAADAGRPGQDPRPGRRFHPAAAQAYRHQPAARHGDHAGHPPRAAQGAAQCADLLHHQAGGVRRAGGAAGA